MSTVTDGVMRAIMDFAVSPEVSKYALQLTKVTSGETVVTKP